MAEYIYLKIPLDYKCVYDKLLKDLSSLGIKGLTNNCKEISILPCSSSSIVGNGKNVEDIFDSWNMFQIACAAFEQGELTKANKIIAHINNKMSYCCVVEEPVIILRDPIYYGVTTEVPVLTDTTFITNSSSHTSSSKKFNFNVPTIGHFIAVPVGTQIKTVENASFRGDWLYNTSSSTDLYTKTNITINGIAYVFWYCEFIVPFNSRVEITLV